MDPERFLLELSSQLTEARSSVTALDGRVGTLEQQDLSRRVGEIREQLGAINEVLRQLTSEPVEEEESDGPGTAPNWIGADQQQARELWDWLLDWCQNILWPVWGQEVWKPCWYRHQTVRIQLTWLCAMWHWAYEKHAPPTRAAEWHLRWWPGVRDFMKAELNRCGYRSDNLPNPEHEVPVPNPDPTGSQPAYLITDFADDRILERVQKDIDRRPPPKKDSEDD
jgi:hypothetical protein